MRKRKVDSNQSSLVEQIRKIPGTAVAHTHTIGKGFPDIVVAFRQRNYLFEIKDPGKAKSARKLTPDEIKFRATWTGQIDTVETIEDVLRILKL